jgi:hypothetical protein
LTGWTEGTTATACEQPQLWSIAAAFDLSANNVGNPIPGSASAAPSTVPPSLLKAIGWVESGWTQFTAAGKPVVSPDFGYGIMQVTSGMPGAFGNVRGTLDATSAGKVASDYRFNIASGLQILKQKWAATPRIGNRDPTVLENWYYTVWAYNGWGWVNNPNNPRFTRRGTPATDPVTYPYQERVLYLVTHPPHDSEGNPLWAPITVTLPARASIGYTPQSYAPAKRHHERPLRDSATYQVGHFQPTAPAQTQTLSIRLVNTGTDPWLATGEAAVSLTYHVLTANGDPWKALSPFSPGVVAFAQHPVVLPHDVLPGKSVTVHATVVAPQSTGNYRVAWDLQQGTGFWFSQHGSLPRARVLRVLKTTDSPTPGVETPTPTPDRAESLLFVVDTSVPDGTGVAAGERFTKGWLVLNDGTQAWQRGWALVLVSGKAMGARRITVPPTRTCRVANILVTLRAPTTRGRYTSVWRLHDSNGHPVGQSLTVAIVVGNYPPGPTPVPSPTPTSGPAQPTPTPTTTPVG